MTLGRIGSWILWPAALVGLGTIVDTTGLFDDARFALHRSPRLMPSTRAVPREHLVTGQPLLSVVVAEADLRHPQRGILVHPMGRGREWERFAYVSYFDEGELQLATGAGLRVHGGKSRIYSANKSFGLFFRRRYGAHPDAALLLGRPSGQLERVVAHNDIRHDRTGRAWQFVNPLAYEIAARVGAVVPRTRPMRFFLNGKLQGVYVLTEHIGPKFLETRFGHSDFGIEDDANPIRLLRWARDVERMTAETVSRTVDLDNLTNWALSILFCGTTDIWQGTLARDQRAENSRWFWINWDMDHSFMDLYQRAPRPWEIDTYGSLLGVNEARSRILTRLFEEDPEYRVRFVSLVAEMLNHRLTPSFLQQLAERHRLAAGMHGIRETAFLDVVEEYFRHRPSVLQSHTRAYLKAGEPVPVAVAGSETRPLTIDGYPTTGPYRGIYFPETTITVEVPAEHRRAFSGWTVNDRPAGSDWRLELRVTTATSIAAYFRD